MHGRTHPAQPRLAKERWISAAELGRICGWQDSVVVVDEKVAGLHGLDHPSTIRLAAGEEAKTFETLSRLCGSIGERCRSGARRVVAIGGGTIGDVVSLAAHLVRRGMHLVQVPTTLLAAVDSSIGGKVAINSDGGGKNAVGAYHFAGICLLCEEVWSTLSSEQHREGLAEAIKMAICLDARLARRWKDRRPDLREVVVEARRLKNAVVECDPFEMRGQRTILNFGHTVGHALETLSGYRLSHGAAVACGMVAALDVGVALSITPQSVARWVEDCLEGAGLPGRREMAGVLGDRDWTDLRKALSFDKKGLFRFVLLRRLGAAEVVEVPEAVLKDLFSRWRKV